MAVELKGNFNLGPANTFTNFDTDYVVLQHQWLVWHWGVIRPHSVFTAKYFS